MAAIGSVPSRKREAHSASRRSLRLRGAVIGDAESSPAAYRRALALDPNDWSLWARLASVSKGEPRRLALREAARLNPLASGS